ncbi:MAG: hypothetical protein R3B93_02105 [Bacteroidia bacterium]
MKKVRFTFIYLIILIQACSGFQASKRADLPLNGKANLSQNDSISITIEANNLSEDFSSFSTKNDEILILIYPWEDTTSLSEPIFSWQFVLDTANYAKSKVWKFKQFLDQTRFIFLLIELDSDATDKQLDPIFRVHYLKILKAFRERNYNELKKYINDEDLLGFEIIDDSFLEAPLSFQIKGIHKLDRYEYTIGLGMKD